MRVILTPGLLRPAWKSGRLGCRAENIFGDVQVSVQFAIGPEAAFRKIAVIAAHRFRRPRLAIGHPAHPVDEGGLILGAVDLAAEEREARAMAFRLRDQLEGVAMRAAAAAEHPDDHAGVVRGQFLERRGAGVGWRAI